MAQQSNLGAPYDPDPDDQLPDNQEPITEDYLKDSVEDVERSWPDDTGPEDVPASGIHQLKEAVKDDMPGPDTEDAVNRQIHSPNERGENQFDKRYFDIEDNPDLTTKSNTGQNVEDALDEEEADVDRTSDDNPDIEERIG